MGGDRLTLPTLLKRGLLSKLYTKHLHHLVDPPVLTFILSTDSYNAIVINDSESQKINFTQLSEFIEKILG